MTLTELHHTLSTILTQSPQLGQTPVAMRPTFGAICDIDGVLPERHHGQEFVMLRSPHCKVPEKYQKAGPLKSV